MTKPPRRPIDEALDLFVFAPIGLAVAARDALPGLIKKGRERVEQQVGVARMMGQFVSEQGRREAGRITEQARRQASDVLGSPRPEPPIAPDKPERRAPDVASNGSQTRSRVAESSEASTDTPPEAGTLAIPDYDSLAASQVVQRLNGLSVSELDQVKRYEAATRGRKTVLGKIEQLRR